MEVRFKWGKFSHSVAVTPGDIFSCNLTEENADGSTMTQSVKEEIKCNMIISHWVMFYIPAVGSIGGIFGGPEVVDKIKEIFCNPVEVKNNFLTA